MSYRIIVGRSAERSLRRRIPPERAGQIREAINALAENPRPGNTRQLRDRPARRLRVGDYRIIYDVDDDRREVFVAEVWHRQRGYR
ncbi:MAG: type II toxin-antitoxin system RelE/ParE family toxin [Actinobacteria bacterium]|nr:type II toxin-antitoxin system RelE/ParE family toxin [Actinomycetota bacterium]